MSLVRPFCGIVSNAISAEPTLLSDATKSIGLTLPRGDPSRLSSLPVLDHVKYPVPYDQNPKVQFRESPTAGSGNFAKEKIKMGEVIFKGPIETYLLTKQEIRSKPQWLDEFMMHYGEQVRTAHQRYEDWANHALKLCFALLL